MPVLKQPYIGIPSSLHTVMVSHRTCLQTRHYVKQGDETIYHATYMYMSSKLKSHFFHEVFLDIYL